jgi:hypothetical protein
VLLRPVTRQRSPGRGDTGQQSGSQLKSKRTQQMIIQTAVDHIQQIRSAARLSLEESTTVGVLVVEAPSSKVAHANKACATLMRHSSVDGSDTFGTALTDYLHPSDHTKVREALARYAAGAGDSGEKLLLRFLPGSSSNGASAELVFPPITLDDAGADGRRARLNGGSTLSRSRRHAAPIAASPQRPGPGAVRQSFQRCEG